MKVLKRHIFATIIITFLAAIVLSLAAVFAVAENYPLHTFADSEQTALADDTDGQEQEVIDNTGADGEEASDEDNSKGYKAIAAGIAVGLAAGAGAIAMGIAIAKSAESTARQPEVKNDIRSSMMLGLVFIETAIIYALIVAILIIFVL